MTNFLVALARRSMQTPAIRPRTLSRFEAEGTPQPTLDTSDIFTEAAAVKKTHPLEVAPNFSKMPESVMSQSKDILFHDEKGEVKPVKPPPIISEQVQPVQHITIMQPAITEPPVVQSKITEPSPEIVTQRLIQNEQIIRIESQQVVQERHERVESHEQTHEILNQRVERLIVETPAMPVSQFSPAVSSAQTTSSIGRQESAVPAPVEIYIGRIEVHAVNQAASLPHHSQTSRPAAKSLEEYLQERNSTHRGGRS